MISYENLQRLIDLHDALPEARGPWRVGFEHASVISEVAKRLPGWVPVTVPVPGFAFGASTIMVEDPRVAAWIVAVHELLPEIIEELQEFRNLAQAVEDVISARQAAAR